MKGLRAKLGLYGIGSPSATESGKTRSDSSTEPENFAALGAIHHFGELQFEEVSPGVFSRKVVFSDPVFGGHRLSTYLPFRLSSILQLSLLKLNEPIHPEELLFLDTETTGLSRQAGVLPFLTGFTTFSGRDIVIEQYFLASRASEKLYLEMLAEKISSSRYLVTYNGKSFDIPLIKNRMILNRKRENFLPTLHFDLLHILKRLVVRGETQGYRQMHMEKHLLGLERSDDVAGDQIPQIYFDYIKYSVKEPLEEVFRHNELDLLGMVFLFLEAVEIYTRKDHDRSDVRRGVARILGRNRRNREAIELYSRVFKDYRMDPEKKSFYYRDWLTFAVLLRREGDYLRAVAIFQYLVAHYQCEFSLIAMLKILEYRTLDLDQALKTIDDVLNSNSSFFTALTAHGKEDLVKRKGRIKSKIARSKGL